MAMTASSPASVSTAVASAGASRVVRELERDRSPPTLLDIILFLAAINLIASIYNAALAPMVLSRPGGGETALGVLQTPAQQVPHRDSKKLKCIPCGVYPPLQLHGDVQPQQRLQVRAHHRDKHPSQHGPEAPEGKFWILSCFWRLSI
mgnify:CR=1 FL=1